MKRRRHALVALLLVIAICLPAMACMWDYDTLAMERQKFPDALELITGKFLRHSKPFYEWRVKDREKRMKEDANDPALYDDLAVAYEKLGNHDKAIELMLEKEKKFPGKYETYANLGTFYIHAGEMEKGVKEIDRAIAINPDAHFGREIYQKHLVNYVLSKRKEGKLQLPLDVESRSLTQSQGFAEYVIEEANLSVRSDQKLIEEEIQKATKGVLGMMRFGNYDSPVLLEILGDLLLSRGRTDANKRLATRAYLKAAYEMKDETSRIGYMKMGKESLIMQTKNQLSNGQLHLEQLESQFKKELAEAKEWYAQVEADEKRWIAEGKNPEEEFTKKYYEEPRISSDLLTFFNRFDLWVLILSGFCSIVALVVGLRLWKISVRRRAI